MSSETLIKCSFDEGTDLTRESMLVATPDEALRFFETKIHEMGCEYGGINIVDSREDYLEFQKFIEEMRKSFAGQTDVLSRAFDWRCQKNYGTLYWKIVVL